MSQYSLGIYTGVFGRARTGMGSTIIDTKRRRRNCALEYQFAVLTRRLTLEALVRRGRIPSFYVLLRQLDLRSRLMFYLVSRRTSIPTTTALT